MKLFIYKTLIIVFFAFVLFEFTLGQKIKKIENQILTFSSKQEREKIANKIREEINRANERDKILSSEDRDLLSTFINKIINELDLDNSK